MIQTFKQLIIGAMMCLGYEVNNASNGDMVCWKGAYPQENYCKVRIEFLDGSDLDQIVLYIRDENGIPIKTCHIEGTITKIISEISRVLNPSTDRVKILEAGIEAALIHLDQDNFRSQAISHAKSRLEKALKDGRY